MVLSVFSAALYFGNFLSFCTLQLEPPKGVEDRMWEWRKWQQVAPGEPCPAVGVYSMDVNAGTSLARLRDNLRARLEAVEEARARGAGERPLAPFLTPPELPPAETAAGGEEVGAESGEAGG